MSIYLGAANLMLRSVASKEEMRYALTGILVDPVRGVTAASDGKRLVEVTLPKIAAGKFPAGSSVLANGGTKPFLLSAKSAQELSKRIGKSKRADDPVQFAALAAVKDVQKPSFLVTDGQKTQVVGCEAIDGSFPDYIGGNVFPKGDPAATIVMNAALLRDTLAACAMGDFVTIHCFKDRVIVLSDKDGMASRAVVMSSGMKATAYSPDGLAKGSAAATAAAQTAPKTAPVSAPEEDEAVEPNAADEADEAEGTEPRKAEPKPETERVETRTQARFHRGGRHSRWRYTRPEGQAKPADGNPSIGQRAFYTYLVRSRQEDEAIAVEHLREKNIASKIDELKALAVRDESFAYYPQWRRLCITLAERNADDETFCRVLNSVTDPNHAKSLIQEWLAKAPAAAIAAA